MSPFYATNLFVLLLVVSSLEGSFSLSLPGSRLLNEEISITRRSLFGHSFSILTSTAAAVSSVCGLLPKNALAVVDPAERQKRLALETLPSGVRVADILQGNSNSNSVTPTSRINVHVIGRLLGKNGWIFEDSQTAGEDPFRLDLGTGKVVPGLEEALIGMKPGGRRRIVVPSKVGYTSRDLEPIPRDFGNRQRLYTTVMNNVRMEREKQALGADLAGVVVFDVELLRFRN